jgi:multiple sugar transport system permease protein
MTDPLTGQRLPRSGPNWRRRGRAVGFAANTTVAWLVALVFSFPLIWTFFTALKPANEVFAAQISFIGSRVLWSNFVDAWTEVDFGRLLLNSLVVAAVSTVLTLVVATLTAFAFARLRFPGRSAVFLLFVITLTLPSEVAVVPLFLGFDQAGLADTWVALILPGLFGAFGAFLLRQFMLQIPAELEEAARLDGASTWRILISVIVPLVRPALSVTAIFTFLGSWNSFLWPLIILNSSDKWTIPIGIAGFTTQTGTQWELLMAACVMTIAPVVVVVAFAQRQLVAAIGAGAFGGR